jgi:hypothetical protein
MTTTRAAVRSDFTYMRRLMRIADQMMRDTTTDYSLGSDFEQLSLELIGCAHTLNDYIAAHRAASGDDSDERLAHTL